MNANVLIVGYIIFWIILYSFYVAKYRFKITFTSFCFLYYALAAVFSLFLYNFSNGLFRTYDRITIYPFIYLSICYLVSFMPTYFYEKQGCKIGVNKAQYQIIDILSIILSICAVLPFFESLIQLPSSLSSTAVANVYDRRLMGIETSDYLSWISRKFYYIIMLSSLLVPICLFLQINKKRKNKYVIFCLILCVVVNAMHEMIRGSRSGLVQNMMYLLAVYLLFRNNLEKKIQAWVKFWGLFIAGISVSTMMIVSISRFSTHQNRNLGNVYEWMSVYAGEGIINFNNDLWYIKGSTGGYRTCSFFMGLKDGKMPSVSDIWDGGDKLGVYGNIFYTWVGEFFFDYGKYYTLPMIILLSFFVTFLTNYKFKINIVNFILLCVWAKILIVGPIFYTYTTVQSQIELLVCLFFCMILQIKK